MSAQVLRARIDELSSEIDLQKALVRKLEHDRCLVQRQLNALVDPVARLTPELSSEIFLQCLPPVRLPMAGAHNFPMRLQNVCTNWNTIALSTPALWTDMQIIFPCAEGMERLLPIWFQRARDLPLSISLRGDRASWSRHREIPVEKLVLPTLRCFTLEESPLVYPPHTAPQILTYFTLPALETLTVPMFVVSAGDLLRLLKRSAPPLRKLVVGIDDSQRLLTSHELHECLHLIPRLAHFETRWPDQITHIVPDLVAALADSSSLLPNLQSLTIRMPGGRFDIPDSYWQTFLRAVSTRRLQLHIAGPHFRMPSVDILTAFKELAADGVQIYIGNKEHNFVDDK
ncbi:hypothetical protein B0H12DRAFT_1138507 [Mycena haematopus]|nr:hypothetical protein B0H12DRAFT_1138507 [Mycena haematopus]